MKPTATTITHERTIEMTTNVMPRVEQPRKKQLPTNHGKAKQQGSESHLEVIENFDHLLLITTSGTTALPSTLTTPTSQEPGPALPPPKYLMEKSREKTHRTEERLKQKEAAEKTTKRKAEVLHPRSEKEQAEDIDQLFQFPRSPRPRSDKQKERTANLLGEYEEITQVLETVDDDEVRDQPQPEDQHSLEIEQQEIRQEDYLIPNPEDLRLWDSAVPEPLVSRLDETNPVLNLSSRELST